MEAARTRARRRLIGALVLLVIGVVGFPILFETQPRPLPVDTPIVVPATVTARRESNAPAAPSRPPPARRTEPQAAADPPAETAVPAAAPVPAAASAQPAASRNGGSGSSRIERVALPASAASVAASPAAAPPAAVVAAAGASAAASDGAGGRFVVQVGAYTDPATLREARAKVEKMGLKTYTQVVNSEAGPRTRVRLGPFASRDEADAAAAKVKRAGLPANILAL